MLYIQKSLDIDRVSIHNIDEPDLPGDKKKVDQAVPGKPFYVFYTVKN